MSKGAAWLCTALLSLAAASAAAGSFSVAPTRVEFEGSRRTAVISLRNADATPLTVQVSMVDWAQPGGEDLYAPTRELLATPPVFTIAPNGEQIIRIALRRAADATQEIPYRIFFQEVPQTAGTGSSGLNIALRVGVPVFLRAARADDGITLEWQAQRTAAGQLQLSAANPGASHVQVTGFDVSFGSDAAKIPVSMVKYVLPGNRVSWMLTPPAGADMREINIQGHSDRGDFTARIAVVAAP